MTAVQRHPSRATPLKTLLAFAAGFAVLAVTGHGTADSQPAKPTKGATALCRESEAALREGNYREALALADRAVEASPDYAPGYVRRARAKYFLGDDDGCLAYCDEAIRHDPELGQAYAYRAPVAWLRGGPAAGVRDGLRAVKLLPDSAEAQACLALANLRAGDSGGAVKLATAAIERDPKGPEGYRVRGLALAAQGDEKARADFDAAIKHSGDRPFYLVARADYLATRAAGLTGEAEEKALADAANDITRALKADPDYAPAHLALADVQAHRERWYDVVQACEKAVEANPRLVSAYLRAAEDLSPRDLGRYQMLQAALATPLDLRELKGGGDFAFGSLLADLQRLASEKMKRDVTIYINYHSFPEEVRNNLKEAKVNLNSLMDATGENLLREITFKTLLGTLCQQVGATFYATPEHIEIVSRETAHREAARLPRAVAPELIAPADLYQREQRALMFEQALRQTVDLRELKGGGDFAFGSLLADLQRLVSTRMKRDVTIYIDYQSFPQERRNGLRETKVNLPGLMDATGENLLRDVKLGRVLDILVRNVGEDVKVRATADYIEIYGPGDPEAPDRPSWLNVAWLAAQGPPKDKPRPEAVRWLTRGIEAVPTSARLHLARGQLQLEQSDPDAAIADATKAIELNPGYAPAYRLRSIAYSVRGKAGDAALARADALKTKP